MKGVRRAAAVLLGFVFFLAGIMKLMDPVGTGLMMESYFNFLHVAFLKPLAKAAGVACCLFETVLGAALITGVWRKPVAAVTLGVLLFFTVLTGVMWFVDPPMDCGCFGEAIHMTHLQSFLKNIILLLLWVLAFSPLRAEYPPCKKIKYVTFALATLSVCAFTVYSLLSIPLMDFTPFSPGVSLFDENSDTASGDDPVLSFTDMEGEYRDYLALRGPVLLFSVYEDSQPDSLPLCFESAASSGIAHILLTSGRASEGEYHCDRRTLMTLNRSNGGVTLVNDGVIIAKWPSRPLLGTKTILKLSAEDPDVAVVEENNPRKLKLQGFLLYVFAVMLLL